MSLTLPGLAGEGVGNGVRAIHSLPREIVISRLGSGPCGLEGHQGSGVWIGSMRGSVMQKKRKEPTADEQII